MREHLLLFLPSIYHHLYWLSHFLSPFHDSSDCQPVQHHGLSALSPRPGHQHGREVCRLCLGRALGREDALAGESDGGRFDEHTVSKRIGRDGRGGSGMF